MLRSVVALVLAALTGAVIAAPAAAQTAPPAPSAQPRPAPCTAAEDRQFDFWIGSWSVTANGTTRVVGTNTITRELGGCVLQEHWAGAGGGNGMSFNHYDAARGVWHQTWVDDSGGLLLLDGGLHDGAMVLSGSRPAPGGKTVTHRITYSRNADGTVRQWWQVSNDGGTTWSTSFDGIYHRAG